MNRFISQFRRVAPGKSAVSGFEKSARVFVAMRGHIEDFGISRVDNDVVYKQTRPVEIYKHVPGPRTVARGVNLPIEGAEIEPIRIVGIYYQPAYIAARGPCGPPFGRIRTT